MQFSGESLGLEIKREIEGVEETVDIKPFAFTPNGGLSSPVKNFRQLFLSSEASKLKNPADLQILVQKNISPSSLHVIDEILKKVNSLSSLEKLLLYLKLPTGKEYPDPLKQPINPLGSRTEITQTISWIKTHLKVDKETSLPKQEVYEEYLDYCRSHGIKPLSTADFGKVMKQVYPDVRPRRLGTRGNSRYCYSGMSKRAGLPSPALPSIPPPSFPVPHPSPLPPFPFVSSSNSQSCSSSSSASSLQANGSSSGHDSILSWASSVLGTPFSSLNQLEDHIVNQNQPSKQNLSNGIAFISRCKIPKIPISPSVQRKSVEFDFKRKLSEDDSLSKTPPGKGGGKGRNAGSRQGKRAKSTEAIVIRKTPVVPPLPRPTPPKLTPPLRPSSEILENGNSLEQEEELARYFEVEKPPQGKSQLRMLLEKSCSSVPRCSVSTGVSGVDKRVSFTPSTPSTLPPPPSPNTQKKFSFVPISPISPASDSPFLSPRPKETPLLASMLMGNNCGRGLSSSGTSVSCSGGLEEATPVPSETADFQESGDSVGGFLIVAENGVSADGVEIEKSDGGLGMGEEDEEATSPFIDTGDLSGIFSFLDGRPSDPSSPPSKGGDPILSAGLLLHKVPFSPHHSLTKPLLSLLDDDDDDLPLPLDDSFDDFTREVTHIGSLIMPPDI